MAPTSEMLSRIPRQVLSVDVMHHDFGFVQEVPAGSPVAVTMRALRMPTVMIIELSSDRFEARMTKGTVRNAYPHAISIVLSGTFGYSNGYGSATARPGEVITLARPDDDRLATYSCSDGYRGIWILAASEAISTPIPQQQAPFTSPLGDSFAAFLASLVAQADQSASDQSPSTIQAAEDLTSFMFSALTRDHNSAELRAAQQGRPDFLGQALTAIRQNAHQSATNPPSIARRLAVSLGHLHRIFDAHERTVAEEIRFQRTRLALETLQDPRLRTVDIDTVARTSGFNSSRSMRRAVIEATGRTPAELRRDSPGSGGAAV